MREPIRFGGTEALRHPHTAEELRHRRAHLSALFRARGARALEAKPLALEGYVTEADIRDASDRALLALPNVSRRVLAHLRAVFPPENNQLTGGVSDDAR